MNDEQIKKIRELADEVLSKYNYTEEPIRDDIFKILRKNGIVLFFPLESEENLDGFHVDRVINGRIVPFVFINSHKYYDKCIFCAAHELGHIYAIEKSVIDTSSGVRIDDELCDEIMNRFAAELLMPEERFRKELIHYLDDNKILLDRVKEQDVMELIVTLMDYFFTPYKAVVLRLYEIGFFTEKGKNHYIDYPPLVIESYIAKGNYLRPRQKNEVRQMSDLDELIREVRNNTIVSERKIKKICEDFEIILDAEVSDYLQESALNLSDPSLINQGGME